MTAILSNQVSRTLIVAVTCAVVAANLVAKLIVEQWLAPGESWWLVQGAIGLERVSNHGIAFGIDIGSGAAVSIIVLLALAILAWVVLSGAFGQSRLGVVAAGLIVGGALGNALDRFSDGAVTDYVALWSWPRFNIADAALTIGLTGLILLELNGTRQARP